MNKKTMLDINETSSTPAVNVAEPQWLPVLMYHRIVPQRVQNDPYNLYTSVADFEAQLRYLRDRNYIPLSFEQLAHPVLPSRLGGRKPVVITFDDGYMDTYELAFPLLCDYNMTATVFLVTDRLGGSNQWDSEKAQQVPLMKAEHAQEMALTGMSIGSHSRTHSALPTLNSSEAWDEIRGSKEDLEDRIGIAVRTFCYPYGRSNAQIQEMVRQAGYVAAAGIEQRQNRLFNISRLDAAAAVGAGIQWKLGISGTRFKLRNHSLLRRVRALSRGAS